MEDNPEQQPETTNDPVPQMPIEPHHETRRERRKRQKLILFISGGVVLALLLLAGVYWFVLRGDAKEVPVPPAGTEQQSAKEIVNQPKADPTPVVYKSAKNNIELTYRKDWKLKEASSGEITITSPQTSYTTLDGQSTTGVFTFKFRIGVPDAMKTTIDKSVAARDSEVIAYDDPPETQRFYTNLSYAGQKKDAFNFFLVTGNTALKTGNSFAYTLVLDGSFYMLAGGFGTDKDGALAFDAVSPSMINSETAQQGIAIVKSLKIF